MNRRSVDLNSILAGANIVVTALLVGTYLDDTPNKYVDQTSLLLGLVLCAETHFALWLERRRRDPFVLWLAWVTIAYYALRLFTLTLFPYSIVFERYAYDSRDSNFALLFIVIADAFLYLGLYAAGKLRKPRVDASSRRPTTPTAVIVIALLAFVLTYFGGGYFPPGETPRLIGVLTVFFSPSVTVPMILAYLFLFHRTLSRRIVLSLGALLALEIVAHTLWGSRSAMIAFAQMSLLVSLAIFGSIKISKTVAAVAVVALPVSAALLVALFTISTFSRAARGTEDSLDVEESIDVAEEASSRFLVGPAIDVLLPPALARAGFFDFSAEIIAHRDRYSTVVNLPAYARSIIDNILTPGFDVFDQPKIANSLLFLYRGWGRPSKQLLDQPGIYQSDQLGIYGELYTLFGYGSLPVFFLFGFGLKRFYLRLHNENPFILAMQRTIVLAIFWRSIDSFGIDWTIGEVLPLVVAVYAYSPFFASRRRGVAQNGGGIDKPATLQQMPGNAA